MPFAGPNFAALIFAIMTADPSPTHEQAAGDPELWAILRGALGKRDVERPSMRAFGVALAEWALSRGIDSDITGTSLAAHWLGDAALSPFSEAPPPVSEDPSAAYDIAIPRPAGLPGRLRAGDLLPLTEAPPPEDLGASGAAAPPPPRRRAGAFLLGAALVASAAIGLGVIRGRASPIPAPSAAIVAAPAPAPAPSASASESPVVAASAPPAIASEAPAGSVTPATSVVKARGAPAPSPRAGAKTPPRKGGLPIAKQPNF